MISNVSHAILFTFFLQKLKLHEINSDGFERKVAAAIPHVFKVTDYFFICFKIRNPEVNHLHLHNVIFSFCPLENKKPIFGVFWIFFYLI